MKIMVICSGGMSTSMLVKAMNKTSEEQNKKITIESGSVSELTKSVETADLIMVAPQVRHRLEEIKNIAVKYTKPVILIEPQIYGLLDGKGALKQALNFLPGG